jgi:enoyl-CoA hydratase/carnithine racemase
VLRGLFEGLARAHADSRVKAVVVTGAGKNFSAGFDINQFQNPSGGGGIDNSINDSICSVLEGGPKPTVAAIQGVALGGGLEVAMGCNARVAAPGSRLGLPELQLGIIPGFGGTQRLPRLVGLKKAIQMMLTSTPIKDSEALKLGLLDAVVPPEQLLAAAKQHALDIAEGRKPRVLSLLRTGTRGVWCLAFVCSVCPTVQGGSSCSVCFGVRRSCSGCCCIDRPSAHFRAGHSSCMHLRCAWYLASALCRGCVIRHTSGAVRTKSRA